MLPITNTTIGPPMVPKSCNNLDVESGKHAYAVANTTIPVAKYRKISASFNPDNLQSPS